MDFKKIDNHYVVFAGNINIATFLKSYPEFYDGYWVLITWLDSSDVLKVISKKRLEDKKIEYHLLDKFYFFKNDNFQKLLKDYSDSPYSIFSHFDELYLFKGVAPIALPSEHFIFGDGFADVNFIQSCLKTMNNIGAERYLSNGCGLNIISRTEINIDKISEIEEAN